MHGKWGILDSGFHDASVNMALDEALLNWHSEGKIPPVLRFYGWKKPSLSLGHFQKDAEINYRNLQKHQCQHVRRLTGGSAVLHDDELTYSIVISEKNPGIPSSIQEAYYVLSKGIIQGYKNLGIEANYAEDLSRERSAICFERPAFYEMVADGKKLSGNAQTRKRGVLLQHGSIPLSIDEIMLFDLFVFPNEEVKARKRRAFAKKAAAINQLTEQKQTYDTVKKAFYEGFRDGLDLQLEPFTLSESQWNEVFHLAETNYSTKQPTRSV
ncbi:lipoate--protein ligase family protein [Virgibacillus siamensis]|uniref:lipoate--protein ligase family protein n=1 Tax=Virgibacillus siamensis TaxID=480071 RepID=UPI000985B657|nr:lipoate--protein ligase family protein [Virgibacillus siamensis]